MSPVSRDSLSGAALGVFAEGCEEFKCTSSVPHNFSVPWEKLCSRNKIARQDI